MLIKNDEYSHQLNCHTFVVTCRSRTLFNQLYLRSNAPLPSPANVVEPIMTHYLNESRSSLLAGRQQLHGCSMHEAR